MWVSIRQQTPAVGLARSLRSVPHVAYSNGTTVEMSVCSTAHFWTLTVTVITLLDYILEADVCSNKEVQLGLMYTHSLKSWGSLNAPNVICCISPVD